MFTLTIKNLLAHKARLVSTAFAVLLGVAFMAGTLVFTDTLTATFDSVLSEANQGVDALVRAPSDVELSYGQSGERIDASTTELIRGIDGVADAAVQVNGYAQLVGPDGEPVGDQAQAPAFGMNWVDNDELNPYQLATGRAPVRGDEIVIDKASADSTGYRPGDVITVLTPAEPAQFTIAGIATFGTADSPAGATVVLFEDTTAQALLASPGQVDGIAVTARDGTSQTELAATIAAALPVDGLEVITGAQVIAEDQAAFDEAFGPFKVFMLVFAFVAVFVGAFIINNTFSITVAQRSREMAMLRALGASRRQVLRSVVAEAAITGLIASAMGVLAGIGVASGIRALIVGAGVELPDGPIVVAPNSMLIAFLVGVTVTVASAILPARRAGRIRPIAALRDVAIEHDSRMVGRAVVGVALFVIGIGALLAGLAQAEISLVGIGALVTLVGVAVLGPIAARPASRILGATLRTTGIAGQVATGNAMRSPKRTARTASALMIGVALVAFIAVFSSSFKSSLAGSLDDTFTGSHVVDSGVFDGRGGLSPELAHTLTSTPGVDFVSEARNVPAVVDGGENGLLQGFTAATIDDVFRLGTIVGDLDRLGTDGIAVDVDTATAHGWTLGSTVPITFPGGTVDFTVAAMYDNGSEWVGNQFVDIAALDAHSPGSLDSRLYIIGDDSAIAAAVDDYPTAKTMDADAFFDQVTGEVDQILGIIYAMLALAIVIALLGVANTLSLSIFERTRELGLLRAVGMTRRQVRSTVRGEAVIIAVFGTLGGIGIGTFFGWATVRALEDKGFDTVTLPFGTLVAITVIAAIAGAGAAVLPARRASRLDVLTALAAT